MMHKIIVRTVFVLVSLLLGAGIVVGFLIHSTNGARHLSGEKSVQNHEIPRLERVNGSWEPSFFEALSERTQRINLPSLRTIVLPVGDLEVRFWYDGRPDIINGFVIRRSGDRWSAIGLRQARDHQPSAFRQEALRVPKSGWKAAWLRLVSVGILTLPDGSEPKCQPADFHPGGYVIETNVDRIYRTYRYSNPLHAECDEAKRIALIEEIIGEEFGLQSSQK